ncbi:hypothetical protein LSTR_LSTR010758 [Laodelphax striatellus]|uniref:Beta-glucuronidase n=1 Tax=Laodelphax striatellus TaxID=195883 RepID=A0A482WQ59_LAOST|nr:hypothetical protein LSTR_LSTR010758 [Laodelphax striatellus]
MPVPSSDNDITQERSLRDHVGFVWYERTFFAPERWHLDSLRVWLRFGSFLYLAHVFLNGQKLMSHEIGHLPFQTEVTSKLFYGKINRLTVAVDNILTNVTVPQGAIETLLVDNRPRYYKTYTFDFFNYAGIHRSVQLYTTPIVYIDDITINTDIENDTGMIYYNITFGGFVTETEEVVCTTRLLAENGEEVQGIKKIEENEGQSGHIVIPNATFWWPYMMHPQPGYMYTVEVVITVPKYNTSDIYSQPVGIRTVRWNDKSLMINGKKVYIRGVGKHEDSDAQYLDIISFNRYNSWYQNTGRLETIRGNVEEEATSWHKKYNKPVLMSEYGADTIAGLHLVRIIYYF